MRELTRLILTDDDLADFTENSLDYESLFLSENGSSKCDDEGPERG